MESNENVTITSPTLIINNFEVTDSESNTKIIEQSDMENLEKITLKDTDSDYIRYSNIINALGLNVDINYPIKVLADAIVEMHLTSSDESKNSYIYSRTLTFKNNKISNIIKSNLMQNRYQVNYSRKEINYALKRLIRNYKYSMVLDNTISLNNSIHDNTIINNINNSNKPGSEIMGFNYNNPRWVPLYNFNI
jgi:hypothetical protein